MSTKAFVILNPVAGQSDAAQVKQRLNEARAEGRWAFDLYETTGEEDLKKIVGRALEEDYDLILACGGDGTVSGAVDGLADSGIPMGILPIGTANAFATELGIPKDLKAALDLVFTGSRIQSVDAIQCGERYFVLETSLGAFSASFDDVEREDKNKLGWLAYISKAIRNWFGWDPLKVWIYVDGARYSFRAVEIALFNTSQVGIIDEDLDADIRLNDGVLDLYAVRSRSFWNLLRMLLYRLVGKPKKAPYIQYWRVRKKVEIRSEPVVSFQADGEVQGHLPASFMVAPGVLKVIVPESQANHPTP